MLLLLRRPRTETVPGLPRIHYLTHPLSHSVWSPSQGPLFHPGHCSQHLRQARGGWLYAPPFYCFCSGAGGGAGAVSLGLKRTSAKCFALGIASARFPISGPRGPARGVASPDREAGKYIRTSKHMKSSQYCTERHYPCHVSGAHWATAQGWSGWPVGLAQRCPPALPANHRPCIAQPLSSHRRPAPMVHSSCQFRTIDSTAPKIMRKTHLVPRLRNLSLNLPHQKNAVLTAGGVGEASHRANAGRFPGRRPLTVAPDLLPIQFWSPKVYHTYSGVSTALIILDCSPCAPPSPPPFQATSQRSTAMTSKEVPMHEVLTSLCRARAHGLSVGWGGGGSRKADWVARCKTSVQCHVSCETCCPVRPFAGGE